MGVQRVAFSRHARQQMLERGASKEEVVDAIAHGERVPAKHGRMAARRNFQYERRWGGRFYHIKQVMPIITYDKGRTVVITVYVFYF